VPRPSDPERKRNGDGSVPPNELDSSLCLVTNRYERRLIAPFR